MIYEQHSIYKSGNNGGGYKEGGELSDADFIKVENNTVSSYDNVSRDKINFYFELKDGEVLNSVIELITDVNSTVYVYVLNGSGIYIPVGLNGSANVDAGKNYNINIVGNSYSIEEVVITPINNEYYQKLYGATTKFKKFGDYYWQMEFNSSIIPGVNYVVRNGFTYYSLKDLFAKNNNFEYGYTLPAWDGNEIGDLASSIGKTTYNLAPEIKTTGTTYWNHNNGNNSTGLSFKGLGFYDNRNDSINLYKQRCYIPLNQEGGGVQAYMIDDTSQIVAKSYMGDPNYFYVPLRFLKHV